MSCSLTDVFTEILCELESFQQAAILWQIKMLLLLYIVLKLKIHAEMREEL